MTWALIAGGGTAGHVVPALAVAKALVSRGHHPDEIHFVGARRGMEAELVPAAGFGITLLPGRGINERKLTVANVAAAGALAGAGAAGMAVVARRRPAIVLCVGGYASLAPGVAAGLLRRPLVLHEQNAEPSAANKVNARFARACAVSLPGTPLPHPVLTGSPVGPEFITLDRTDETRAAARHRLGVPPSKTVVAAWGGSLGSRRINEAVLGLVEAWSDREDLLVHHVVGRRDFATWRPPSSGRITYRAVEYESAMADLLLAADVGVSRAGGMTVAELALAGLPAILVPLPIAAEDHQSANARALVDAGGALTVQDRDLDATSLAALLEPLIADPERRSRMSKAVAALGRPEAAERVAELMETHAR